MRTMEKKRDIEDEVEQTIISICDEIKKSSINRKGYAETVEALASLVEARARLY